MGNVKVTWFEPGAGTVVVWFDHLPEAREYASLLRDAGLIRVTIKYQ